MSTRLLYVIATLACLLAVLLYWQKDDSALKAKDKKPKFDYWADDIEALQTDALGRVEMVVNAKRLEHEHENKTLHLKDIQAQWFRYVQHETTQDGTQPNASLKSQNQKNPNQNSSTQPYPSHKVLFNAQRAAWSQHDNSVVLNEGVTMRQMTNLNDRQFVRGRTLDDSTTPRELALADIVFETPRIHANLNQETLEAGSPVLFFSNNGRIAANTLSANLSQGIYRFDDLQATYQ